MKISLQFNVTWSLLVDYFLLFNTFSESDIPGVTRLVGAAPCDYSSSVADDTVPELTPHCEQ